jgi:hypothetical protein
MSGTRRARGDRSRGSRVTSRDARARIALAAAIVLLLAANGSTVVARREPERAETAAGTRTLRSADSAATATTLPPEPLPPTPSPPPRLYFGVRPATAYPFETKRAELTVHSWAPGGSDLRPEPGAPRFALTRWSSVLQRGAASKLLDVSDFTGCGIAGCTQSSTTAQGIASYLADGSDERMLSSEGYDSEPTFGPDGRTILFTAHVARDPYSTMHVLAFMDVAGNVRHVIEPPPGATYERGRWSPDGRTVAALRRSGDTVDVVLLPLDGGPERVLARGAISSSPGRTMVVPWQSPVSTRTGAHLASTCTCLRSTA